MVDMINMVKITTQQMKFSIKDFSVNVTKSAVFSAVHRDTFLLFPRNTLRYVSIIYSIYLVKVNNRKTKAKATLTRFLYKKHFYQKMSLQNYKTLRICFKNLQPQMLELQFLRTLIFPRAL